MSRQMAGLQAWILQRITAVYLAVFSLVALPYLLFSPPADYLEWQRTVGNPWVYTTLLLFVLAVLIHAWVGLRDIAIDYVKPFILRLAVLILIGAALVVTGIWVVSILLAQVITA